MLIYLTCMYPYMDISLKVWNVGPSSKVYNTWLREKMKNEERAQIKAHYQKEIESIKGEVARLINMLEQALSFKNGKGMFAQPFVEALLAYVPYTS